ncbi:hypothetical protein AX777_02520 [Sphingobium yanoikuyae]|uniref:Uncharacterized protein n=1 Tax=Sphingobium yanoikuyae TaxID=13690 RepID=A0A177J4Y2_SPHYA|nr:hypothetical protein AX777_02520 [Sphingobium yanoikuyae]
MPCIEPIQFQEPFGVRLALFGLAKTIVNFRAQGDCPPVATIARYRLRKIFNCPARIVDLETEQRLLVQKNSAFLIDCSNSAKLLPRLGLILFPGICEPAIFQSFGVVRLQLNYSIEILDCEIELLPVQVERCSVRISLVVPIVKRYCLGIGIQSLVWLTQAPIDQT